MLLLLLLLLLLSATWQKIGKGGAIVVVAVAATKLVGLVMIINGEVFHNGDGGPLFSLSLSQNQTSVSDSDFFWRCWYITKSKLTWCCCCCCFCCCSAIPLAHPIKFAIFVFPSTEKIKDCWIYISYI